MFRLSAFALFAATVTLAAPVPKGDKKDELYFPTTVGATRVSTIPVVVAGNAVLKSTETVTRVEEKGGVYLVSVDADRGGVSMPSRVYEVSAKGVFEKSCDGVEAKEPKPLLKAGGKAGDTWEVELPEPGGTGKQTFTLGEQEEVEVPAGKYKAVRVDIVTTTPRGPASRVTMWHAPGVGVVKSVATVDNQEVAFELTAFTPGKGEKKDEPKKDK